MIIYQPVVFMRIIILLFLNKSPIYILLDGFAACAFNLSASVFAKGKGGNKEKRRDKMKYPLSFSICNFLIYKMY